MKFGVFDHMDDAGVPLGQLFADRLKLIEAYDRAGLYGYHLAEHHSTPLGCAASPGLFLAAVAQRTSRLRFGPLVYLLPFYHPLRLIEEICMLDQMSGGRFAARRRPRRLAVRDPALRPRLRQDRRDVSRGLPAAAAGAWPATNSPSTASYYQFDKVPMMLKPVQRPHPPLWYGTTIPENADWPAANDVNIVTIALRPNVRTITDRYRASGRNSASLRPARRCSASRVTSWWPRPTSRRWRSRAAPIRAGARASAGCSNVIGAAPRISDLYPETFDGLMAIENGIAGSPADRARIRRCRDRGKRQQLPAVLVRLRRHDARRAIATSFDLFAREVMPAFAEPQAAVA